MDQPLLSLPQHVFDTVFGQLRSPALANCSLVCQAWRDLPYEYLPKILFIQPGSLIDGILDAGLHRCKNLQTICVASRNDPVWARFAAALAQQQLPSLRELHIKHSSHTDAAHLEQLRGILQVQGPQCCLHLSVNDKASLQALLPLLPLRGLSSLDLNVPYIADGALQLLLHAATVQTAAPSRSSSSAASSSSMFHPQAQQPGSPPHPQQQGVLRVGLWVCCWGGCPGLQLSEALTVYSKLQQVPGCVLSTCESINITCAADLAALSQLQALEALGINFVSDSSSKGAQGQQAQQGVQQPTQLASNPQPHGLQAVPASAGGAGGEGSSSHEAAWPLSVLTSLSSSLKELNIRGFPSSGWHTSSQHQHQHQHQQQHQHQLPAAALQHHTLSALTGLTKLSLVKDWSKAPLPVGPIAALTLLQELTVERQCLLHARELSCLSSLTGLRALSLLLAVTADELLQAVQEGTWTMQGPDGGVTHRQQQQQQRQQQDCAAVVNKLGLLGVGDSNQAGGLHDGATADAADACSCCCSAGAVSSRNGGDAGSEAARVGCDALLHQVLCCTASEGASNPALLDWSWLRHLQQLETAWLQVPHLDLSCLPDSLLELDAQQPRDLTRVSITCDFVRGMHLPQVQRLVLPHLLLPCQQSAGEVSCSMLAAEVNGSAPVASSYGDTDAADSDSGSDYDDASVSVVQQHYEAALMLCVIQGCPELKELELVQWQPPAVVICKAAQHLRSLQVLSLVAGVEFTEDCQQQVAGLRAQHGLKPLDMQLQEPLVLSSYPWSSVLAVR